MDVQYQLSQETLIPVGAAFDGSFLYTFQSTPLQSFGSGFDEGFYGAYNCFQICDIGADPGQVTVSLERVSFAQPVGFVSVSGIGLVGGNGAELLAYNSANQLVGECFGSFSGASAVNVFPSPNCYTLDSVSVLNDGYDTSSLGTMRLTAPNISFILFGSQGTQRAGFSSIDPSSVPEPSLVLLLAIAAIWIEVRHGYRRCADLFFRHH